MGNWDVELVEHDTVRVCLAAAVPLPVSHEARAVRALGVPLLKVARAALALLERRKVDKQRRVPLAVIARAPSARSDEQELERGAIRDRRQDKRCDRRAELERMPCLVVERVAQHVGRTRVWHKH